MAIRILTSNCKKLNTKNLSHRLSRTPLIRRMPFPAKETFKNSLAFELFRMRFEIGSPAAFV